MVRADMLKRLLPRGGSHSSETPASHFSMSYEFEPCTSPRLQTPSLLTSPNLNPHSHHSGTASFDQPIHQTFNNMSNHLGTSLPMRSTSPIPPHGDHLPGSILDQEPLLQHQASNMLSLGHIERSNMLKSMKTIESLLGSLSQFNELYQNLNKCQKKITKNCKELATVLTEDNMSKDDIAENVMINALTCTSHFFGALHEVTHKTSKSTQKEYHSLQDLVMKAFKRIVKEERAHDDHLEALETKIQKANAAFDKQRKPIRRGSHLDSQEGTQAADRYYASISSLGLDVTKSKSAHSSLMYQRRDSLCRLICKSVYQIADNEWRTSCEAVQRTGLVVGRMTMWANFCTHDGMPRKIPKAIYAPDLTLTAQEPVAVQVLSGLNPHSLATGQAARLEALKEQQVDVHRSSRILPLSRLASPAHSPNPASLSLSSGASPGLGLVQSDFKTLAPRPRPHSMQSSQPAPYDNISTSQGVSQSNAQANAYYASTVAADEAQSRLMSDPPHFTSSPVGMQADLTGSIPTAPLAVRKHSYVSQQAFSPRLEEMESMLSYTPSFYEKPSTGDPPPHHTKLTHSQTSISASSNPPEDYSHSDPRRVDLSILLQRKISQGSTTYIPTPADHHEPDSLLPLAQRPNYDRTPEYAFKRREGHHESLALPLASGEDDQIYDLIPGSVLAPPSISSRCKLNASHSKAVEVDPNLRLGRQTRTASSESNGSRTHVTKLKQVYSYPPIPRPEPTLSSPASELVGPGVDPSCTQPNSVAALASRFSALAHPYMRHFEPVSQPQALELDQSRVSSPVPVPRSSPYLSQCLASRGVHPVMRPTHHLPLLHPPLSQTRSLTPPNPHQFRFQAPSHHQPT